MAVKHLEASLRVDDGRKPDARHRTPRSSTLACSRKAVPKSLYCRLKWIECTLLLKHLTGMGSPKTALGLMTPVAYEVRTGVYCGRSNNTTIKRVSARPPADGLHAVCTDPSIDRRSLPGHDRCAARTIKLGMSYDFFLDRDRQR